MKKSLNFGLIALFTLIINSTGCSIPELIKVPGNKAWTNTGYNVNIGDKIEIVAIGEILPDGKVKCNPNGVPDRPDWQAKYCVINTNNHACLIGKIGENGKPFFVGTNLTLIADSSGELFLGINDTDLKNNSGEYSATITLSPKKD